MTILTAVQAVCNHPAVSEPAPTEAVGSSDPLISQIVGLLGIEARELRSRHNWSGLITPATLTLSALGALGVASVTLPADFRRFVGDGSLFSTSLRRDAIGPVSTEDWIQLTRYLNPTSTIYWRKRGSTLDFVGGSPGDVIVYEYISDYPFANTAGTSIVQPLADTDTLRVPEELAVLGAVWRWRSSKGYDYSQEVDAYEGELDRAVSDDRGSRQPLQLSRRGLTSANNLPFLITPT